MSRSSLSIAGTLCALCFLGPALLADDKDEPQNRAGVEKTAREISKFDKGDPGWKVRMEALVNLAKIGPAAVPVLVKALKDGPPVSREFAAQALVLFAEPGIRPALEQAIDDTESGVRIYAIAALSMLGRLESTQRYERMLENDPSGFGVRPMLAAALARDDRPDPIELRRALGGYDLRNMDSARLGEMAPDFALTDFSGKTYRLSQFRGKKTVVLRFILFDF
jgi:hypothetical protein